MTTVSHPLTETSYPLILDATKAAESVGTTRHQIVKLCEAGEIDAAPHSNLERWRIYTLPLWQKFGLIGKQLLPITSPSGQEADGSATVAPARGGSLSPATSVPSEGSAFGREKS